MDLCIDKGIKSHTDCTIALYNRFYLYCNKNGDNYWNMKIDNECYYVDAECIHHYRSIDIVRSVIFGMILGLIVIAALIIIYNITKCVCKYRNRRNKKKVAPIFVIPDYSDSPPEYEEITDKKYGTFSTIIKE